VATDAASSRFAKKCASAGLVIGVGFHGMGSIYGCMNWGEAGARTVQINGARWSQQPSVVTGVGSGGWGKVMG